MAAKNHVEDRGLSRAVEKQLRRWEIAAGQSPAGNRDSAGPAWSFVALSNQVGAGGDDVAAALGEKLGWPVFDKQILQCMAGDDEVRARLYRSMDERDLGWVEESFRSMMQQEFRRNDYFHRLTQTVMLLARRGPAIFLGRGVDMILPRGRGLRVQVIASRQRRIASFAQRSGMTPEQASMAIERIEQERRDFIRRDFHADADDPTRFDLLINVERFSPQDAAKIIEAAMAFQKEYGLCA
jgi:cytidylate kinase